MRTRRSWRNQDRLWKALGGPLPATPAVMAPPVCGNCANFSGLRNRGNCSLHGIKVNRLSLRECFREGSVQP